MKRFTDEWFEKTCGLVITTDCEDDILPYFISLYEKDGTCVYQSVALDAIDLVHTVLDILCKGYEKEDE